MIYREFALPEALERTALCAWEFRLEIGDAAYVEHTVPPDGTTNLLLTKSPEGMLHPLLIGPSLTATKVLVARGWNYTGLRLRPEAAPGVIGRIPGVGASEPLPLHGSLAAVWCDLAALMTKGARWNRCAELLRTYPPASTAISSAVDLLMSSGGMLPISQIAAEVGLGDRQLRRGFRQATGISPKQFASVQRVRRALILALSDRSWVSVAHEAGFADQPHLARDIKGRFGAAPAIVTGYLSGIRHELVSA